MKVDALSDARLDTDKMKIDALTMIQDWTLTR